MSYKYKQILTENNISTNLNNDDKLPNSKAVRDYVAENSSSTIKLKVIKKEDDSFEVTDLSNNVVSYASMIVYMQTPENVVLENSMYDGITDSYIYINHSDDNNTYMFQNVVGPFTYRLAVSISDNEYSVFSEETLTQNVFFRENVITDSADDRHYPSSKAVKDYVDNNSNNYIYLRTYLNHDYLYNMESLTPLTAEELMAFFTNKVLEKIRIIVYTNSTDMRNNSSNNYLCYPRMYGDSVFNQDAQQYTTIAQNYGYTVGIRYFGYTALVEHSTPTYYQSQSNLDQYAMPANPSTGRYPSTKTVKDYVDSLIISTINAEV